MQFNFDRDEDGFYDFEDCEDLVGTINPAGVETWNGRDDDCDDAVDDGLSRKNLVTTIPDFRQVHLWDAVNESLVLSIGSIPENVVVSLSWQFGDYTLTENVSSDGRGVVIEPIDCEAGDTTLTIYLCDQGSGPQQITATLVDSGQTTVFVWDIDMDVWIPPETLSEKLLSYVTSPTGLAATLVVLLSVIGGCVYAVGRFSHKRKLKDAYEAYNLKPEKFSLSPEFQDYDLPSAPDLNALMGQQNTPVELPSVPVFEDEDEIPRAPKLD
jgi:hypothetical protein